MSAFSARSNTAPPGTLFLPAFAIPVFFLYYGGRCPLLFTICFILTFLHDLGSRTRFFSVLLSGRQVLFVFYALFFFPLSIKGGALCYDETVHTPVLPDMEPSSSPLPYAPSFLLSRALLSSFVKFLLTFPPDMGIHVTFNLLTSSSFLLEKIVFPLPLPNDSCRRPVGSNSYCVFFNFDPVLGRLFTVWQI